MSRKVKPHQKLELDKIEKQRHNNFNGNQVVSDLLKNMGLWYSAIFGNHLDYTKKHDVIAQLINQARDITNGDTLYLLTDEKNYDKLLVLAHNWGYDDVDEMDKRSSAYKLLGRMGEHDKKNYRLLILWWD